MMLPDLRHVLLLATTVLLPQAAVAAPQVLDTRQTIGELHIPTLPEKMTLFRHGDLTGDFFQDGVLKAGSKTVVVYAPGLYHAMQNCPGDDIDVAVLADAAPDGSGRDALVRSTVAGLELCWIDSTTEDFASLAIGSPQWAGAERMRCGDLDGDGTPDIVGLLPDRHTLLTMTNPFDPATEATIVFANPIDEFDLIEWDAQLTGREIAAFSGGIGVHDQSGNRIYGFTTGGAGDDFTVVRRPGAPYDRLAATMLVAGAHRLYCMDPVRFDVGAQLGLLQVNGSACGDYDLDGEPDFVLAHKAQGNLLYFRNRQGTSTDLDSFGWYDDEWDFWDATADGRGDDPVPEQEASPLFVDIDSDGDADIVMPDQLNEELVVRRSGARAHRMQVPVVRAGALFHDIGAGTVLLRLILDPPPEPPQEDDALEVWAWTQADQHAYINEQSTLHEIVPCQGWPMQVDIDISQSPLVSPQLTHVTFRLVDVAQGTETVTSAGPAYNLGVSTSGDSLDWLANEYQIDPYLPGNFHWFRVFNIGQLPPSGIDPGGGGGGGGPGVDIGITGTIDDLAPQTFNGEVGGGGVPTPCVPCVPPEKRPM